jgi:hypothetical protein
MKLFMPKKYLMLEIETAPNNALEIMLHLLSQLHSQRSFAHFPHPQQRHQSAPIGDNPPFQFG